MTIMTMDYNKHVENRDRLPEADMEHVRQLMAQMTEGLPEWCQRRRRNARIVMMVLLVAAPTLCFFALPQSEPTLVACNMTGGEAQVVDCARNLISMT